MPILLTKILKNFGEPLGAREVKVRVITRTYSGMVIPRDRASLT